MSVLPRQASTDSSALRWRSVVNRDALDNSFVYAVRSTGIYCRACCPARLARRANVEFFDGPSQAEAAGYRPCKRCRPRDDDVGEGEKQIVQEACSTIAKSVSAGEKPDLRQLASDAHLSYSHFHRTFKKISGVTPGQYAKVAEKERYADSEHPLSIDSSGDSLRTSVESWGSEPMALYLPEVDTVEIGGHIEPTEDFIDWNAFDAMIGGGPEEC